ncbi:hypothetical protein [Streptomyces qinzhouensis]|uniref:Uncharacterized protein n=1 Tax=Streptomyces qinzhouensis TaxID=2599401 RepID=A0A5B8JHK5_9ACTN|nr:hypothetical protein [Streptomyces qinzhouensis]QDY80996.1 hypothetical protein FQU76_13100 [Streptomyces qinzhouensis]
MSQLPGRIWSDEDWDRIQRGYASRDMDEKWNAFAEDETLFLHRSWTGRGVYEAVFAPVNGGGRQISGAVVERDPEFYKNTDDAYDCVMLELVISSIVLGEPATELRSRLAEAARLRSPDAPAGVLLHSQLGLRTDS